MAISKFGFNKRSKQAFQAFVICAAVAVLVTAFYLSRSSMEQIASNGWSIAFAFVLCMAVVLIRFVQYRTMNDDFDRFRSEYKEQQRKVNFSGDPDAQVDMSGFKFKSYKLDYVEFALAFGIIAIGLSDIIISGMKGSFDTTRLILYLLMAFTYGTGTQWSNAVFDGMMSSVNRELGIDIKENNPSPSISAQAFDEDESLQANAAGSEQDVDSEGAAVSGELPEAAEAEVNEVPQEVAQEAEEPQVQAAGAEPVEAEAESEPVAGEAAEGAAEDAAEDAVDEVAAAEDADEAAEDEADDGPDLDYDDEETLAFNRENGIFEISMDELDATDDGAEEAAAASEASTEGAEPTDSEKE